mmetsp:Transcript_16856/g.45711  ORF Transcript_16856/g.45711 Transcript_16856/m.45711 type:complete len:225 (-) Transcript_16856:735-1409(-)
MRRQCPPLRLLDHVLRRAQGYVGGARAGGQRAQRLARLARLLPDGALAPALLFQQAADMRLQRREGSKVGPAALAGLPRASRSEVLPELIGKVAPRRSAVLQLRRRGLRLHGGGHGAHHAGHERLYGTVENLTAHLQLCLQEGVLQELRQRRPPPRIPLEATPQDLQQLPPCGRRASLEPSALGQLDREARVAEPQHALPRLQRRKGRLAVDHLVEDDAQRPDV